MNEYEITYLANPTLNETSKEALDEYVDKIINEQGGEISYTSAPGSPGSRRRLNFPIADQRVAWLRVVQTRLNPAKIADLRAVLNKHTDIIRVAVLQTPRRDEVSSAIFDTPQKPPISPTLDRTTKLPSQKVTMMEVEEKIEAALEEEVK